ncbi:MAG: hypothetical protein WDM87_15645 [Terracidiphilus sp.]
MNLAKEKLGANDEYLQAIVQGGDIDKAIDALVDGTKLGDAAFRKSLSGWGRGRSGGFHRSDDHGRAPSGSDLAGELCEI